MSEFILGILKINLPRSLFKTFEENVTAKNGNLMNKRENQDYKFSFVLFKSPTRYQGPKDESLEKQNLQREYILLVYLFLIFSTPPPQKKEKPSLFDSIYVNKKRMYKSFQPKKSCMFTD